MHLLALPFQFPSDLVPHQLDNFSLIGRAGGTEGVYRITFVLEDSPFTSSENCIQNKYLKKNVKTSPVQVYLKWRGLMVITYAPPVGVEGA